MEVTKIHEDERGSLYTIRFKDKEFLLIETKQGYSRGGDYHQSKQHFTLLKGKIQLKYKVKYNIYDPNDIGCDMNKILEEGNSISIDAEMPHMFTALTDCLVVEWLEGEREKTYFEEYRRLVE